MEDGLYTIEAKLADPKMVEKLAKFVKASMKGWEWAAANPEAAAKIVLERRDRRPDQKHQVRMVGEINKLTAGSTGKLDVADYDLTVKTLLTAGGEAPVITKEPKGAWTHAVTDAAGLK